MTKPVGLALVAAATLLGCGDDGASATSSQSSNAAGTSSAASGAGASGGSGGQGGSGATGAAPPVSDYCFCVTGGDNTGTGFADAECEAGAVPFQPQVHFCEDFDDESYRGPSGIVGEEVFEEWADGPFDHSWDPEGFVGSAARFTAHTFDSEDSDGLTITWPAAIAEAPQGNIGYLLYMGADWTESFASSQEWKHTLLGTNNENGQTAMLMEWPTEGKRVWSACSMMSGLCQDEFDEQYPEPSAPHSFAASTFEEQWIYVELEHIPGLDVGTVNVYVYSRSGNVVGDGPMATIASNAATPHVFTGAGILAYIEGTCVESGERQSTLFPCSTDSYARIDVVKIADQFIGPPPGFVIER
jgi:hypothetical protein